MPPRLTIGTRRSPLAMWQARLVRDLLLEAGAEAVEIVPLATSGDRNLSAPLADFGGKGLFLKELESALVARRIDLAVHSVKDMPADLPRGLLLAAVCRRGDARDALVARGGGGGLEDLRDGAVVGTCSPRRKCLLLHQRPDLQVRDLRGNLAARLARLDGGEFDAVVLAAAGLQRLGLGARATQHLPPAEFVPAAGQGAIGVECRADDETARAAAAAVNDATAAAAAAAERAVVRQLGGGCHLPVGAYAEVDGVHLNVNAMVGSGDGKTVIRDAGAGTVADAAAAGAEVGKRLMGNGGAQLVERWR
ncbi:MAG: hydroxymethylbilane synthase [Gammaproteobacteria bacterium]|nr:hydroxymethylbilane synthase [Gammaproteobacteria bacterium]